MKELLFAAVAKFDWTTVINGILIPFGIWFIKRINGVLRRIDQIDERLKNIEYHLRLRPVSDIITPPPDE